MVAGMLVSFAALLVLLQALVAALAEHMATGWASLIVGVVVAVIGFGLIKYGQSSLKATNLVPSAPSGRCAPTRIWQWKR